MGTKEDGKPALVPKLRFPEFRGAEGWKSKMLGEVTTKTDKRNKGGKSYPVYSISNKTGFTPQSQQFEGVDSEKRGYDIALYKLIESKTFAYNPARINVGSIGYSGDLHNVIISSLYVCFQAKPEAADQFLLHFFGTSDFEKAVNNHVEGGIRSYLFYENFARIPIALPSPAEQQKIAECLSSVDEVIAAQARKLDALKTHKKGLMQQLFPREGETQPRLRFPEFHNDGEWKPRKAGTLFANRVTKGEEGLPIYSVTMHDGMVKRDSLDRNFYDIEDAAGNKKVYKEDIAYNMMRMWQGALGVAPEDCLVSPAYIVLAPMKDAVPAFFQYLFKLPETLLLLTSHSRGLTKDRLRLYYCDFASIPLRCPEPPEQHRIASCLSSLDALIAAETQKLEALQRHKRSMMQQLFPSPEEQSTL